MSSSTRGFKEISAQLSAMGRAAGGVALRSAALSAVLPALRAAQSAAPVGNPPYGPYASKPKPFDPYPKKTYKGRSVTPGFTKRSVIRRSSTNLDKTKARVSIGVRNEAFYAVQFLELGTSKISKRPWLEPSFRASVPAVEARFKERLVQLIDKAAKK